MRGHGRKHEIEPARGDSQAAVPPFFRRKEEETYGKHHLTVGDSRRGAAGHGGSDDSGRPGFTQRHQIQDRGRRPARHRPLGHGPGGKDHLCPCALPGGSVARRQRPAYRPGPDFRQRGDGEKPHRSGGQRRCPLPHDRGVRRGQDRLLSLSQSGVRLRQRDEFSGTGHQRGSGPELRCHRPGLLRISGVGH